MRHSRTRNPKMESHREGSSGPGTTEAATKRKNMDTGNPHFDLERRRFLALAGKGLGLAALSSSTIASLMREVQAATKSIAHLTPEQAAMDQDYWAVIQNAFTV